MFPDPEDPAWVAIVLVGVVDLDELVLAAEVVVAVVTDELEKLVLVELVLAAKLLVVATNELKILVREAVVLGVEPVLPAELVVGATEEPEELAWGVELRERRTLDLAEGMSFFPLPPALLSPILPL